MENKPDQNASGGVDESSAGSQSSNESITTNTPEENKVAYETYQKLLKEAKGAKERVREYEKLESERVMKSKQAREDSLQKQGEYKKLLELREKEIEDIKNQYQKAEDEKRQLGMTIVNNAKKEAFLSKLPGKLKYPELIDFANLDDIAINPDTGDIDMDSALKTANSFMDRYGNAKVVDTGLNSRLPSTAPGGTGKLTYDQWLSLPLAQQKKRMKEVIN